jgi:PAS domain S-box-containing protein
MWSGAMRTAELERINLDVQQQSIELEAAYRSKNAIVETALDAMIAIDRDGRDTAWNPQAELTFGWRSHEILGKPLAETIIPERFREPHRNGIARFLATRESHVINRRIEVGALHRHGHEFPVELAIAPICSGDSISFCAFARDITQRVQNADALRAAKEAAEFANRAKSAFLANMSHEIRTPLNAILGFTDNRVNDVDGDCEQRREHLQTVHDSGQHLLALIDDVLDLSKIESGGMDVEPVRCSPHEIISATVSMLRMRAEERGLDLKYFRKSETPEFICTDPDRLRQILMNLIGNAIKFTEVGGVQVVARLETRGAPQLVVEVIDTGIGIEANSLDGIFDPFVQADNSITRRFGGTGLGLSISRRLARLLDGDLRAESQGGRGSVFSLTIPTGPLDGVGRIQLSTAEATPSRSVVAEQPAATLPPCRILLVEDGVTNRKLITLILDRAGATTRCAENGQAGVEAASREPFDIILMDMQMPVMDGYRATG